MPLITPKSGRDSPPDNEKVNDIHTPRYSGSFKVSDPELTIQVINLASKKMQPRGLHYVEKGPADPDQHGIDNFPQEESSSSGTSSIPSPQGRDDRDSSEKFNEELKSMNQITKSFQVPSSLLKRRKGRRSRRRKRGASLEREIGLLILQSSSSGGNRSVWGDAGGFSNQCPSYVTADFILNDLARQEPTLCPKSIDNPKELHKSTILPTDEYLPFGSSDDDVTDLIYGEQNHWFELAIDSKTDQQEANLDKSPEVEELVEDQSARVDRNPLLKMVDVRQDGNSPTPSDTENYNPDNPISCSEATSSNAYRQKHVDNHQKEEFGFKANFEEWTPFENSVFNDAVFAGDELKAEARRSQSPQSQSSKTIPKLKPPSPPPRRNYGVSRFSETQDRPWGYSSIRSVQLNTNQTYKPLQTLSERTAQHRDEVSF